MLFQNGIRQFFSPRRALVRAGCLFSAALLCTAALPVDQASASGWTYVTQSKSAGIFDLGSTPLMVRCGRIPGTLVFSSDLGPEDAEAGSSVTVEFRVDDMIFVLEADVGDISPDEKGRVMEFTTQLDDAFVTAIKDGKSASMSAGGKSTPVTLKKSGFAIHAIRIACAPDA